MTQTQTVSTTITRHPPGMPVPLSFAQEQIWLRTRRMPELAGSFNESLAIERKGPLDVGLLRRCFKEIMRRHESWRTTFDVLDGRPIQVVHSVPGALALRVEDLRRIPEATRELETLRIAAEEASRPFDLKQGPMVRATLVTLGEERQRLFVTMHQSITDPVSAYQVLPTELTSIYEAFSAGKASPLCELPIQYADFAYWERQRVKGEILQDELAYWRKQLASGSAALQWPEQNPRSAPPTSGRAAVPFTFPTKLSVELSDLSQREGLTLFVTLAASLGSLLYRYTSQEEILLGTLAPATRRQPELQGLLGRFINNVVLRTSVSGEMTFRELLHQAQHSISELRRNDDLPFEYVADQLGLKPQGWNAPLPAAISLAPRPPHLSPGWEVIPMEVPGAAVNADLYLETSDGRSGILGRAEYNPHLFDADAIAKILGHWQTLLQGVVQYPGRAIARLPLLTSEEKRQVLISWNQTTAEYPKKICLHEMIEARARQTPKAVAVQTEERQLTYELLNVRANQLANYLKRLGVAPDRLVGVCVERSPEMIVALLAVMKAGGAYVPLDPASGSNTVDLTITNNGAKFTVTNGGALTLSGDIVLSPFFNLTVTNSLNANVSLGGLISGSGGLVKNGSGNLLLNGAVNNTYSGGTIVNAGTLELNDTAGATAMVPGNLVINSGIVLLTEGNQIADAANVTIDGGLLNLNNFSETISNLTLVDGGDVSTGTGTLTLGDNITAPAGGFNVGSTISGRLSLGAATRTIDVDSNRFLSISAQITGGAGVGFIKTGPGHLILSSSNTYSGPTTINEGVVVLSDSFGLGSTNAGTIVASGASVELTSSINVGMEALTLNGEGTLYYGGALFAGSGTVPETNSWAGDVTLNTDTTIEAFYVSKTIILSGAIGGSGALTKAGAGTLVFSGSSPNTYTNVTTVHGTLLLGKSVANGSILGPLTNWGVVRLQTTSQIGLAVPIVNRGLFDLNDIGEAFGSLAGDGDVTLGTANLNPGNDNTSTVFTGTISGAGSVTKSGSGTMTLTGNNTYLGSTAVSGGTLLVNGSQPQSAVTVNTTATLGGTGTVGVVIGNGNLAPGASPGTLTTSNLTFSSFGDYFVELTGPIPGTDYDQLNVRGTNNLANAVLHLTTDFTKPIATNQQFVIINNDGTEPITGTFSGLPEGTLTNLGGLTFRINYGGGTGNDVVLTITNVTADFFFTNVLGGDFLQPPNWFPNAVPGPANNVNFTNDASYSVNWTASLTNANAFFNASSSIITQANSIGTWQLTNSYIVGQNPGSLASVTHSSGAHLSVTNSAGTAVLEARHGTNRLSGGVIDADHLTLTNTLGVFEFNGGTLNVRTSAVNNAQGFFVGNGTSSSILTVIGNGTHSYTDGLTVRNNGTLAGNGSITGAVTILNGATLSPGSSIGKLFLNSPPNLQGTVKMELSKNGSNLTNDLVQVPGTLTYGGSLMVTHLGPDALAPGDGFQLFSAGSYAGVFVNLTLPSLNFGLAWTNKLLIDGSIEVFALPDSSNMILLSEGWTYSQNFDSLSNAPANGSQPWADSSTLRGWYASRAYSNGVFGPFTYTSYRVSDGSVNNGLLYSFGTNGVHLVTDRALGLIASATPEFHAVGLRIRNDTAVVVSNILVSYTGEQWRNGGNVNSQPMYFTYVTNTTFTSPMPLGGSSVSGSPFDDGTFVSGLHFNSPTTGASATPLDGNANANRTVFTNVILPGLVLSPGDEVLLRWGCQDESGNDHGFGIDDVSVSFSPVTFPPAILSAPAYGPGSQFQFNVTGLAGWAYAIQVSTNLAQNNWVSVYTNTSPFVFVEPNAAEPPQRFYRAVAVP